MVRVYEEERTRGQVINIASGRETSMNSLVSQLMAVMSVPDHKIIYSPPRPGDVRRHCGDVSRMKEMTGFNSRTISTETLAETVNWYRTIL